MMSLAPRLRVNVSIVLGAAHYLRGEIGQAWEHLEEARLLDDSVQITHEFPVAGADPALPQLIRSETDGIVARINGLTGRQQGEMPVAWPAVIREGA